MWYTAVHLSKHGYLESLPHANITTHTLTPAYIKCRTNLISCNFDVVEIKDSFNNAKIFSDFVKIVNSQVATIKLAILMQFL